jgi:hypothetical protein
METEALVFLLLLCTAFAAVFLGLCAWGLAQEWQARKRGCESRAGLRAVTDWVGTLGISSGMAALVILAVVAGRQEGWLRIVPLVLVNLVMQPLCLLFLASGLYRLGHACCGRLTHAFQVLPPETVPVEQYRSWLVERALSGLLAILFACGLSYVCLRPWL